MEPLKQFLDAGGMAIIGVIVGSCLTYLFAFLTRRRQEKREDRTRWYEKRLQAYVAYYQAVYEAYFRMGASVRTDGHLSDDEVESVLQRLYNDLGAVHFLGSSEAIESAEKAFDAVFDQLDKNYKSGDFSGDFLVSRVGDWS